MSLEGQQLGEFEILERLGQGGMGAVYKARQISLRRTVALKTLQASLADDADYIARFQQEAMAAAVLNHPNLVQVYSAGQSDGLHWFAMEYVAGESARARLKRKGRLDPLEAIAIVIHVASALEYGWRKAALIHRDIKPDNIFLSEEGEVKLGDLGLAKSVGQSQGLTMTGRSMGSPYYISPEQVHDMKDVDLRADIYSLGCTLYHLLSGKPPYEGSNGMAVMLKHLNAPVPDLRDAWPECPSELAAVVQKMMRKAPEDRPQSYGEVNAELRCVYDLLSGATVPDMVAMTQQAAEGPKNVSPSSIGSGIASKKMPAAKGRLPLSFGIGIALFALAATFVLFKPKAKKPGAAPVLPEHIAGLTATGGGSANPPREAGAIRLWDAPDKLPPSKGIEFADNLIQLKSAHLWTAGMPNRDAIIRASIKLDPDSHATGLVLRCRSGSSDDQQYEYQANVGVPKRMFVLYVRHGKQVTQLASWPWARDYAAGGWFQFEIRAIGDAITVSVDGQPLGTVHDSSLMEAGEAGVFSNDSGSNGSNFRDIVYVPLDHPASASAAPGGSDRKAPEWRDALSESPLKEIVAQMGSRTAEGLVLPPRNHWTLSAPPLTAVALRWRGTARQGWPSFSFEYSDELVWASSIHSDGKFFVSVQRMGKWQTVLSKLAPASGPPKGDTAEILILRMANHLRWYLNGSELFRSDELPAEAAKAEFDIREGQVSTQSLEYLPLEGLAEAEALKLVFPNSAAVPVTTIRPAP